MHRRDPPACTSIVAAGSSPESAAILGLQSSENVASILLPSIQAAADTKTSCQEGRGLKREGSFHRRGLARRCPDTGSEQNLRR